MSPDMERHFARYIREENVVIDGYDFTRQQDVSEFVNDLLTARDALLAVTAEQPEPFARNPARTADVEAWDDWNTARIAALKVAEKLRGGS